MLCYALTKQMECDFEKTDASVSCRGEEGGRKRVLSGRRMKSKDSMECLLAAVFVGEISCTDDVSLSVKYNLLHYVVRFFVDDVIPVQLLLTKGLEARVAFPPSNQLPPLKCRVEVDLSLLGVCHEWLP